jgi:hypothetical protein
MRGAVRHAAETEFGGGVKAFAVEAVEERGGGGAIEAAIVKTEPYAGHVEPECAFLSLGANFPRNKALNNASGSFGSQAEIRSSRRAISMECSFEYRVGSMGKVG